MARDDELLRYVERLGVEFLRREMDAHVKKLRVYYLALKRGLTQGRHELDVHWSEALVIEWLKLLKLAPFDQAYEVRPKRAPCRACAQKRDHQSSVHTDMVFPGGSKMRCFACGAVWIEHD